MKRECTRSVIYVVSVVITSVIILINFLSAAQADIRYVDCSAASPGTGMSWDDPCDTIQCAIDAASAGDEIWVKEGICFLDEQINVNKSVFIYGGFPS